MGAILVGWPAILGSLAASGYGIARGRPGWLVAGAVLVSGFAWLYLRGWPMPAFRALGYALPFLHLGGALAVQRRFAWLAWLLLLPHAAVAAYLAALVIAQGFAG